MILSVLIVYPHDCVADWELGSLLLPNVLREYPERISLAQEKIKSQSIVFNRMFIS